VGFFFNFAPMNIILFDSNREHYYPLSYTRPISDFRMGILTIKEKWEKYYKSVSVQTVDYLSVKFPLKTEKDNLWINSKILPCSALITELKSLRVGELLGKDGETLAFRSAFFDAKKLNKIDSHVAIDTLENIWDIFSDNEREIKRDFILLTKRRNSQALGESNTLLGTDIFIEKGAKISCSILNTENIVMRPFKIHPPESFRTLPWRNGLGSTVELLLENSTQRKEFSWRLSIASVATGGPFSDFSGYDRRCYYSKGRALRLIILTVPASPLIHRLTALILKVRI